MGNTAFIALGSNIGNRYDYLTEAIKQLESHLEIKLVNISSIYETDPVGYEDQDLFLNMVIEVMTSLCADELLDICLKLELTLGRKREIVWGPRTIDLDILLYNQENIETEKLIIPHPRMLERNFVMIPLSEIKPDIIIPNTDKPLEALIKELPNKEGVRLWKRKNGEDVFEPIGS
jgi:2-amino-4-hydroxy-6-hydroxymethyldihydropteridine diphosphokinase